MYNPYVSVIKVNYNYYRVFFNIILNLYLTIYSTLYLTFSLRKKLKIKKEFFNLGLGTIPSFKKLKVQLSVFEFNSLKEISQF